MALCARSLSLQTPADGMHHIIIIIIIIIIYCSKRNLPPFFSQDHRDVE
jgi:hypothetical protein